MHTHMLIERLSHRLGGGRRLLVSLCLCTAVAACSNDDPTPEPPAPAPAIVADTTWADTIHINFNDYEKKPVAPDEPDLDIAQPQPDGNAGEAA